MLATFSQTCYEFHVTRGESFEKAQQICKSHGKLIFIFLTESNLRGFKLPVVCVFVYNAYFVIKRIICVFEREKKKTVL